MYLQIQDLGKIRLLTRSLLKTPVIVSGHLVVQLPQHLSDHLYPLLVHHTGSAPKIRCASGPGITFCQQVHLLELHLQVLLSAGQINLLGLVRLWKDLGIHQN